jgi:hypothetical protein
LYTSIEHLSPIAKKCFARLSVFSESPSTFSLENMRVLWSAENLYGTDIDPILHELLGHGLLDFNMETGRYQMHALLIKLADSLMKM